MLAGSEAEREREREHERAMSAAVSCQAVRLPFRVQACLRQHLTSFVTVGFQATHGFQGERATLMVSTGVYRCL